jgi:hypothetical protein
MKKICFHPIFLVGCAVVAAGLMLVFGRRAKADVTSVTVIRVIDFDTREPISGVVFKTLCTGLINPTSTNFVSDAQGIARVRYYEAATFIVANVSKAGYAEQNPAIQKSVAEVVLKRL